MSGAVTAGHEVLTRTRLVKQPIRPSDGTHQKNAPGWGTGRARQNNYRGEAGLPC